MHLHSLSPFHYWVPWIIFSTDLDSPTLQLGNQVLQGQALLLLVNTSTDIKGFYSPSRRWSSPSNGVYSLASFYYSQHFGHHHCEYLRVSPEKKWVIWRPQCLHYRPLSLNLSNVFSYPVSDLRSCVPPASCLVSLWWRPRGWWLDEFPRNTSWVWWITTTVFAIRKISARYF